MTRDPRSDTDRRDPDGVDGESDVVLTSAARPRTRLALRGGAGRAEAEVTAPGLSARCPVHDLDQGALPGFAAGLAAERGGWNGTRTWRSVEDQLQVDATWHGGGHVVLEFTLRPSLDPAWTTRILIAVDAGAQLEAFARDLAHHELWSPSSGE